MESGAVMSTAIDKLQIKMPQEFTKPTSWVPPQGAVSQRERPCLGLIASEALHGLGKPQQRSVRKLDWQHQFNTREGCFVSSVLIPSFQFITQ